MFPAHAQPQDAYPVPTITTTANTTTNNDSRYSRHTPHLGATWPYELLREFFFFSCLPYQAHIPPSDVVLVACSASRSGYLPVCLSVSLYTSSQSSTFANPSLAKHPSPVLYPCSRATFTSPSLLDSLTHTAFSALLRFTPIHCLITNLHPGPRISLPARSTELLARAYKPSSRCCFPIPIPISISISVSFPHPLTLSRLPT